jgi:hypothetical protein
MQGDSGVRNARYNRICGHRNGVIVSRDLSCWTPLDMDALDNGNTYGSVNKSCVEILYRGGNRRQANFMK